MGPLDEIKSAIRNDEIHESYKRAKFRVKAVSNIYKKDPIKFRVFVKKVGHRKFVALGGDEPFQFDSETQADSAVRILDYWAGN